jgi:hypothetical protein
MSTPCDRPIDDATLADYWLENDPPEIDAIEEHLLGCDGCAGRLRGLAALGEGVRRLAREGVVEMVVTPSFLEKATREGLRAREYRVAPGGRVDCTVTPEDDMLVARLVADFQGLERLDIVAQEEGQPPRRIEDVPIRPQATELIVAQAMPYVRTLRHVRYRIRLLSPDAGGERLLGEYTFDHYPTPG